MGLAMNLFQLVLFVVGAKSAGKLSDSDHVMLSQVIRFLAFRAGVGLSLESLFDLQNMWKLQISAVTCEQKTMKFNFEW